MQQLIMRLLRLVFSIGGWIAPDRTATVAFGLFCTPMQTPKLRPRDHEWLNRAETFSIPFADGQLRAFRWRPVDAPGEPPRVLLVHGWESRAARLGKWVDPLLAQGFEVVAFDGPAHGESDGRRASMPDFVEAISTVAAATGPLHAIVGHSLGAASSAIAVAGEHLTGLAPVPVDRLVLIAGPDRALDFFRQFARLMGLNDRVFAGFLARIEAIGGHPAEAYSTASVLSRSPVPTLIIHDRDDEMIPFQVAQTVAAASPAATLRLTEGLGHHRIVSRSAAIEPAIDWISQPVTATPPIQAVA